MLRAHELKAIDRLPDLEKQAALGARMKEHRWAEPPSGHA
jgi:hypothetical protein